MNKVLIIQRIYYSGGFNTLDYYKHGSYYTKTKLNSKHNKHHNKQNKHNHTQNKHNSKQYKHNSKQQNILKKKHGSAPLRKQEILGMPTIY